MNLSIVDKLGLKYKLIIPIGIALLTIIAVTTIYISSNQIKRLDEGYRSQLRTMAVSSTMMVHSFAEEFTHKQNLRFHRITNDHLDAEPGIRGIQEEALQLFRTDRTLETYERTVDHRGTEYLYVYAPARIGPNCRMCHNESGVDIFTDAVTGDLVGMFGVSGSLEHLYSQRSGVRLAGMLIGIGVFFVVAFIIQYFLDAIVIKPIRKIIASIERSDLNHSLRSKRADEIGMLLNAFGGFVSSIRMTLYKVADISSSVASSSAEISASTEEIAAGAQEQSSQAGEVASAVEEMTKTIVENSKNASETEEVAKKSRETAERGYKVVEDTLTGMRRIADVVRQSAGTVGELGKSSDQIGEIISVIDDIADQTNLLALNAAIEAARAGEQGRGFAVVADEVRKLAERTTKATKEIALMIKKIQSDTGGAVRSMEEGTKEVDEGITLADRAGEALQEIVQTSQKVTDMVAQIAAASEQQSSASEQISKNVEAINSITQETAGGTEQVARAANELNVLTEELRNIISQFHLETADAQSDAGNGRQYDPPRAKRSGRFTQWINKKRIGTELS
jgi:methyl-accepting chemotaxis protein